MPVIRIDVLQGRPPEMLERLIQRVSETVADTLETPIDRVRVVITEVPPHLWGIGGVPASRIPGRTPAGSSASTGRGALASAPRPGGTPAPSDQPLPSARPEEAEP